jgi:hypothetical protein
VHKSLFIINLSCGKQLNKSRTLLRGVSDFLSYFPYLLPIGVNLGTRDLNIILLGFCFVKISAGKTVIYLRA